MLCAYIAIQLNHWLCTVLKNRERDLQPFLHVSDRFEACTLDSMCEEYSHIVTYMHNIYGKYISKGGAKVHKATLLNALCAH